MSWENEGFYCDARAAVRFPPDLPSYEFGPAGAPISAFKGSSGAGSRRYYSHGPIIRVEMGLSRIWAPHRLAGRDLNQFLESVLHLPVTVRSTIWPGTPASAGPAPAAAVPAPAAAVPAPASAGPAPARPDRPGPADPAPAGLLHEIGPSLAELVLASTTRRKIPAGFRPESWWVSSGQPMIFVEYHAGEIGAPPRTGHEVYLPEEYGLRLDHWWASLGQRNAQAWLLGRTRDSDLDALRRVRIHLMRLHAELECAKRVLWLAQEAAGSTRLAPKPNTPEARLLHGYLERLQRLLRRDTVYGQPQAPILAAAIAADQAIAPDDWVAVGQVVDALMRQADQVKKRVVYPT